MEVVADRSFGTEPVRLGLPDWGADIDLDELGSACHVRMILHVDGEANY
jgi:hypothetical protein